MINCHIEERVPASSRQKSFAFRRLPVDYWRQTSFGKVMVDSTLTATGSTVTELISRLRSGDLTARGLLISQIDNALKQRVHVELGRRPLVHRWEQTDDVLQDVRLKLWNHLEKWTPSDEREFYAYAAAVIRNHLIDLVRHYGGPEGAGRHHQTRHPDLSTNGDPLYAHSDASNTNPPTLAQWAEFHERVEHLGMETREVFNMIFYCGVSRLEAARVLGVSERTIGNRLLDARRQLASVLPEM